MPALNYKHLRYFWTVARVGSIARASALLHVTPHSISAQLRTFESALGATLLHRVGRRLEITEAGRRILGHAEEIFTLGDQIVEMIEDASVGNALPFRVGIGDSVPKSIVYRLLEPALRLDNPPRLVCREGQLSALLGELAVHRLDVVVADRPMPAGLSVRGFSHLLIEDPLAAFAAPALAAARPGDFPANLERAPFLMPGEDFAYRGDLLRWLDRYRVRPHVVAEFDDTALIKTFGHGAAGWFVAPSSSSEHLRRQYGVIRLGELTEVRAQVFAISTERRLTHPVMQSIRASCAEARPRGRTSRTQNNLPSN